MMSYRDNARRRAARGGFTLLELMAALSVLTVGLLGAVQSYHFGLDKIRAMRESAIARGAVQNEIETLRALPFNQLADRENAPFASLAPDLSFRPEGEIPSTTGISPSGRNDKCGILKPLVRATPSLTIRTRPEGALKEVDASIRWRGDNGRWIEKRLTTLIADKESR